MPDFLSDIALPVGEQIATLTPAAPFVHGARAIQAASQGNLGTAALRGGLAAVTSIPGASLITGALGNGLGAVGGTTGKAVGEFAGRALTAPKSLGEVATNLSTMIPAQVAAQGIDQAHQESRPSAQAARVHQMEQMRDFHEWQQHKKYLQSMNDMPQSDEVAKAALAPNPPQVGPHAYSDIASHAGNTALKLSPYLATAAIAQEVMTPWEQEDYPGVGKGILRGGAGAAGAGLGGVAGTLGGAGFAELLAKSPLGARFGMNPAVAQIAGGAIGGLGGLYAGHRVGKGVLDKLINNDDDYDMNRLRYRKVAADKHVYEALTAVFNKARKARPEAAINQYRLPEASESLRNIINNPAQFYGYTSRKINLTKEEYEKLIPHMPGKLKAEEVANRPQTDIPSLLGVKPEKIESNTKPVEAPKEEVKVAPEVSKLQPSETVKEVNSAADVSKSQPSAVPPTGNRITGHPWRTASIAGGTLASAALAYYLWKTHRQNKQIKEEDMSMQSPKAAFYINKLAFDYTGLSDSELPATAPTYAIGDEQIAAGKAPQGMLGKAMGTLGSGMKNKYVMGGLGSAALAAATYAYLKHRGKEKNEDTQAEQWLANKGYKQAAPMLDRIKSLGVKLQDYGAKLSPVYDVGENTENWHKMHPSRWIKHMKDTSAGPTMPQKEYIAAKRQTAESHRKADLSGVETLKHYAGSVPYAMGGFMYDRPGTSLGIAGGAAAVPASILAYRMLGGDKDEQ